MHCALVRHYADHDGFLGVVDFISVVSRLHALCGLCYILFYLPPTKEEVNAFAHVRFSACLLARLLKNACMDLDEMLRVDRCRDMDKLINF